MDELLRARQQINEIDEEMARLFCKRMKASELVAHFKKENGLLVLDEKREKEVIERNSSRIEDEKLRSYYISFLKNLMSLSKNYQQLILEGMKIGYSGVAGAFGHIAAQRIFPNGNAVAYEDFDLAYKAVENGECDCCVLPIENSFAGEVGQTIDLIFSGELFINGIYELEIHQNLLGTPDATVEDIRKVTSHPQALSQCHEYIKMRGFETEEANNTALAAKTVAKSKDKSLGAIASVETAEIYGLKILEANINKSGENTTRFAVLSKTRAASPSLSSSVLMFTVKNEAGSLAKALDIIGAYGFNMRTLRSRSMKKLLWQYYFYVEAEGDIYGEEGQKCLEELKTCCDKIKVVGSYNNLYSQEV